MTKNRYYDTLPIGGFLNEYRLDGVLGRGGFGVTYLGLDTHLQKKVAIKEYFPGEYAIRTDGTFVKPKSVHDEARYLWGRDRFIDEAQSLALFNHPNINRVHCFFQANNTAYIVLDYLDGSVLEELLRAGHRFSTQELNRLFHQLTDGLRAVHRAGYVHRDIKPGNIMICADWKPVLYDFGAARIAIGIKTQSITTMLTPGYAPLEQYDGRTDSIGPWTDIYALGMVLYRCAADDKGGALPDAVARARAVYTGDGQDLLTSAEQIKSVHGEELYNKILWAISLNEKDRPQSIEEWTGLNYETTPSGAATRGPVGDQASVRNNKSAYSASGNETGQSLTPGKSPIKTINLLRLSLPAAALSISIATGVYLFYKPGQKITKAELYFRSGQYDRAIEEYSTAIRKAPENARLYLGRARSFLKRNKHKAAITDLTKVIAFAPSNYRAYLMRGVSYDYLGNYKLAIRDFSTAVNKAPKRPEAYNYRGSSYSEIGYIKLAIEDFSTATRLAPHPRKAIDYYGRAAYRLLSNKHTQALEDFNKAIELNPKYYVAYNDRGIVHMNNGRYQLALKDFSTALKINPNYVNAHLNRGKLYLQQRRYRLALKDFHKGIEIGPHHSMAYVDRGDFYLRMKNYSSAILDYNKAVELDPRNPNAYRGRGDYHYNRKQLDLAARNYSKSLEIEPDNTTVLSLRANIYFKKGLYKEAVRDYDRILRIDPGMVSAYLQRGLIHSRRPEDSLMALEDYNKAIELAPNNALAYQLRGKLHAGEGLHGRAIRDFSKAIAINPKLSVAYLDRGHSYEKKGLRHLAEKDYATAKKLKRLQ